MNGPEYLLPDEMTISAAAGELARHFPLRDGRVVRETERMFYDTFDGLLYGAGLSLSSVAGELELVERSSGAVRARLADGGLGERAFAFELPPGPMRDALGPIIEVRALLALARVHTRERPLDVLDDERKTVVRMALEEPALVKASRERQSLRPRLRVAAVRGYDQDLRRVEEALQRELGWGSVDQPLVDEAVRSAGGAPGGVSSKLDVPLEPGERGDHAAAAVLRRLLEVIVANLEGAIGDVDTEFLHDLRVAVRRSRAVQRELHGVFGPRELARFRAEFRWLQLITGEPRDLDVYVLEFDEYRTMVPMPMRPDLEPLLGVLRDRRLSARASMVRALRSTRASRLLSEWAAFLDGLAGPAPAGPTGASPELERPDAARPIGKLAGRRIRKVYRRMVRMGEAIDRASPAEAYHELRKKGKELRYLLELFGAPLYPAEVVRPMVKALKGLQDVLGSHQDREIQVAMLHSLRDEVAAQPEGAATLMAMGALVERLDEDQLAARSAFAERFAEFSSSEQRKLVKDTFA